MWAERGASHSLSLVNMGSGH